VGLDLNDTVLPTPTPGADNTRQAIRFRPTVLHLQDCVSAIEVCDKPVIAALNGFVIGGGVDIASACDVRYASSDAVFSIKVSGDLSDFFALRFKFLANASARPRFGLFALAV
jgi:enoyl-CoA hydratase/carnithine racemase